MKKRNNTNLMLSIASLLVSLLFLFYGAQMILSRPPAWVMIFGFLTVAYGLTGAVLLFLAWTRGGRGLCRISRAGSIAFLVIFVLASLDVEMISGLEWAGIVIVSLMIFVNWLAVRQTIVKREAA